MAAVPLTRLTPATCAASSRELANPACSVGVLRQGKHRTHAVAEQRQHTVDRHAHIGSRARIEAHLSLLEACGKAALAVCSARAVVRVELLMPRLLQERGTGIQ